MAENTQILTPGVRSMFLSTISFFMANAFVKQVAHIPAMETVFFRCIVATAFCVWGLKRAKANLLGTNHLMLVLRGVFGTTALYFFFVTLQQMPIASAQTIQYLSPIFTATIAIFVLKESVRPTQWFFYAIAFSGVLLIEQFDSRIELKYLIFGIISAFCSGVAYNLVRSLRGKEHPLTVVLHFQLIGAIVGAISLFFVWEMPTGWDWLFLFLIGVFSQLGQVFLTDALQRERIAGVAIVNYTGLVYALAIGWIVFGETHGLMVLAGMVLVVFGVLLSVVYGRRQSRLDEIEATAG
ncbi:MAG TPA: DMT family transporter [Pyrinomonadaceae bacterium]|nr:DMT family transporter [Chloracidobacterium sp.]MBP9936964.1 DMT family transporter [Pyrinomonadaceae bacterium]MBK7802732.1 DMT family transporter [Chloracidobacterium sp.]MBK9437587.1 DMT family transporter [Chloracidobacterium sp.]MBL0240252.1 DMT family transporter [Chloracidobacterium sp.]